MKYDFDYYPPRPVDVADDLPSIESLKPLKRICEGVWVAPMSPEPWLESGEYLNIDDFWLAAPEPSPGKTYEAEDGTRVRDKTYLSNATYVFQQLCYLLSKEEPDGGKAQQELFHEYFNPYDKFARSQRNRILLETQVAKDFAEELEQRKKVPGIRKAGKLLLQKVFFDDDSAESKQELDSLEA